MKLAGLTIPHRQGWVLSVMGARRQLMSEMRKSLEGQTRRLEETAEVLRIRVKRLQKQRRMHLESVRDDRRDLASPHLLALAKCVFPERSDVRCQSLGRARSPAPKSADVWMIAHGWRRDLKDVGDQALMRGLVTAFPRTRPGLSRSYGGHRRATSRPQSV